MIDNFPGLRKIEATLQNKKEIVIACKICYEDKTKKLQDCLVTCYQKQAFNAKTHLRYKHPKLLQQLENKKKIKYEKEEEDPLPVYKQSSLVMLSPKAALDRLHYLVYCFINVCGISARVGTSNKL